MDMRAIIEQLARRRTVERLIQDITHRGGDDMADLAQMVYEALLMTGETRISELWEQGEAAMNCYIAAIIRNQYYSDSSRFYYDFRRYIPIGDYETRQDSDDQY